MSIVQTLTEGIVQRDMAKEGQALLNKWSQTGLLEGLTDERQRSSMARLLENQAKELLRESSSMAGGDVEGFAAVAFPTVRRVFAGLIANDLVSVQPMSLPSGLIFFLDFTVSTDGAGLPRLGYGNPLGAEESIYGGNRIASQVTGGVQISGVNAERGAYNLNNGYTSPTASASTFATTIIASGTFGAGGELDKLVQFDPEFTSGSTEVCVASIDISSILAAGSTQFNADNMVELVISGAAGFSRGANASDVQARRLTRFSGSSTDTVLVVMACYDGTRTSDDLSSSLDAINTLSWPQKDNIQAGGALGSVVGAQQWGLEAEANIPEIDIKVDSIAITAVTKKLKAKWTPELGQDLNAYHNLDAEVELTSILSEQIALEIDREILEDLIKGAKAGTFYWSRSPGLFVDRATGLEIGANAAAPDFTGTVSEWYETLIETINDVSAQIHRKTLRGGANFIVCGPEVANILEFTAGFRANVTADADKGEIGAVKVGSLSRKFDVMVDPYFPRNVILVGRRGSSFLESGYVYAPYVPLQTTPTIFGPEDFVPRKGVMTRYGKKMVRPDMYGLVVVRGLLGESGAQFLNQCSLTTQPLGLRIGGFFFDFDYLLYN